MYTKRIFSPVNLLLWTRHELLLFVVIAVLPVLAYDTFDQRWLHLPWLPVALVGTAVAFILSFQNNAAYARCWEARKIWGGIVNSSRSFGLAVSDFVTDHFAEQPVGDAELARIKRRMILRHLAWLAALRHLLRKPRPWGQVGRERTNREWKRRIEITEHRVSLEHEVDGYLSRKEFAAVRGTANPATQILGLQSRGLRELQARGLLDDFRHMELQNLLMSLLEGQGKPERIKNFPYPRQYATLNAAFLWIFILLIPLGLVLEFAEIGELLEERYAWVASRFVWASVPFSVTVMWVFHTMERIGRVTENPFEGSVNDVPITTIARGIEIDLRELLGEDPGSIPAPIEPRHDTQT